MNEPPEMNAGIEGILKELGLQAPVASSAPKPLTPEERVLLQIDVFPGVAWAQAYHEAGHVVVGVFLGHQLASGVRLAGRKEVRFENVDDGTVTRAEEMIQIAIAGPIAEASVAGSSLGAGSDIPKVIELLARVPGDQAAKEAVLSRLAERVRAILREGPVDEVARAILRQQTHTKAKLEAVLKSQEWPSALLPDADPVDLATEYLGLAASHIADSKLRKLLHAFLVQLPEDARAWLLRRGRAIMLVAHDDIAYTARLRWGPSPCDLIVLRKDLLLGLPREQAFAVVAHELGHIRFRYVNGTPTAKKTEGEIQADAFVLECGLAKGLRDHLSTEQGTATGDLQQQLGERIAAIDNFLGAGRGNASSAT